MVNPVANSENFVKDTSTVRNSEEGAVNSGQTYANDNSPTTQQLYRNKHTQRCPNYLHDYL